MRQVVSFSSPFFKTQPSLPSFTPSSSQPRNSPFTPLLSRPTFHLFFLCAYLCLFMSFSCFCKYKEHIVSGSVKVNPFSLTAAWAVVVNLSQASSISQLALKLVGGAVWFLIEMVNLSAADMLVSNSFMPSLIFALHLSHFHPLLQKLNPRSPNFPGLLWRKAQCITKHRDYSTVTSFLEAC